jgi:hypothetical protein
VPTAACRCGSGATRNPAALFYHGWKYDVTGQCIDVPSEPRESGFCQKVKLKSYPLVQRGPVLWTYMGPPDKQPPLPEWEFATVPADQTFVSKRLQECNWLQAMEGGIDSSHVSFLHRGDLGSDPLFKGAKGNQYNLSDMQPYFEVWSSRRALYRRPPQRREWQLLLAHHAVGDALLHHDPAARRSPDPRSLLDPDRRRELLGLELRLPSRSRAQPPRGRGHARRRGVHCKYIPGTYRPLANKDNDYLIDRAPEGRQDLQRRCRLRNPGRLAAGEHGADLRPHQGEPRSPPTTASSWRGHRLMRRRQGAGGEGLRAARRRSGAPQVRSPR